MIQAQAVTLFRAAPDALGWIQNVGLPKLGIDVPENLKLDANIEYRISDRLTVYAQGRNITNENHVVYEAIGGNAPVAWRVENYGANFVFGIRGQL